MDTIGEIARHARAWHRPRRARIGAGLTESFVMATGFLIVCLLAGVLVPKHQSAPDSGPAAAPAQPAQATREQTAEVPRV